MDKQRLILLDFDGTITSSDTLPLYMRHATGWWGYLLSMLAHLPALILLACSGWRSVWGIDAQTTKEKLLHRSFAGRKIREVDSCALAFIEKINQVVFPQFRKLITEAISRHDKVVIVTASPEVWVKPWALHMAIDEVIGTRLETNDGIYTGRFIGKNCNGEEKVRRIAELYPRTQYHIVAYGNSSGDIPMLQYAHEAYMCHNGMIKPYKNDEQ